MEVGLWTIDAGAITGTGSNGGIAEPAGISSEAIFIDVDGATLTGTSLDASAEANSTAADGFATGGTVRFAAHDGASATFTQSFALSGNATASGDGDAWAAADGRSAAGGAGFDAGDVPGGGA